MQITSLKTFSFKSQIVTISDRHSEAVTKPVTENDTFTSTNKDNNSKTKKG